MRSSTAALILAFCAATAVQASPLNRLRTFAQYNSNNFEVAARGVEDADGKSSIIEDRGLYKRNPVEDDLTANKVDKRHITIEGSTTTPDEEKRAIAFTESMTGPTNPVEEKRAIAFTESMTGPTNPVEEKRAVEGADGADTIIKARKKFEQFPKETDTTIGGGRGGK